MAWRIYPKFDLPEGFFLEESEDFLYLLYKGRQIGIFNSNHATPKDILEACIEFLSVENEEVKERQ